MRRLSLLAALLAGCTFQPGSAFGSLDQVSLTVSWPQPAVRLDGQGRWKTDNDYRLRVDRLTLALTEVSFAAGDSDGGTAGGTATAFDPAEPPPGYANCHNGHCHRADGSVVDYETIRAGLAGGKSDALRPDVMLPITWQPSLLGAPQTLSLRPTGAVQELGRATWTRAGLRFGPLQASGTVTDAVADRGWAGDERRWTLTLTPPDLQEPITVPIDRTHPPGVKVSGVLTLSERLFDGLSWSELPRADGVVDLATSAEAVEQIRRQFAESDLTFTFER